MKRPEIIIDRVYNDYLRNEQLYSKDEMYLYIY